MKFKVGDVISNGRLYRKVLGVGTSSGGVISYILAPLHDKTDERASFKLTVRYVELEYYLNTKLHELLLGLDLENDTVYNGEKGQT